MIRLWVVKFLLFCLYYTCQSTWTSKYNDERFQSNYMINMSSVITNTGAVCPFLTSKSKNCSITFSFYWLPTIKERVVSTEVYTNSASTCSVTLLQVCPQKTLRNSPGELGTGPWNLQQTTLGYLVVLQVSMSVCILIATKCRL